MLDFPFPGWSARVYMHSRVHTWWWVSSDFPFYIHVKSDLHMKIQSDLPLQMKSPRTGSRSSEISYVSGIDYYKGAPFVQRSLELVTGVDNDQRPWVVCIVEPTITRTGLMYHL